MIKQDKIEMIANEIAKFAQQKFKDEGFPCDYGILLGKLPDDSSDDIVLAANSSFANFEQLNDFMGWFSLGRGDNKADNIHLVEKNTRDN